MPFPARRALVALGVVLAACGARPSGEDGGSPDAGGAFAPLPCTPGGFAEALAAIDALTGVLASSADEQQAYARWSADGGALLESAVNITVWRTDGGAEEAVPGLTATFNGCPLVATMVPGVGAKYSAQGPSAWVPQAGRALAFELVQDGHGVVYRSVHRMPDVLPNLTETTLLSATQLRVRWTPIAPPFLGTPTAYLMAYKDLGGGGLQGTGVATVVPGTGEATLTLSGRADLVELELQVGTGLRKLRLSSTLDRR